LKNISARWYSLTKNLLASANNRAMQVHPAILRCTGGESDSRKDQVRSLKESAGRSYCDS